MAVKLELKIGLQGTDGASQVFAKVGSAASSLSQRITALATSYLAVSKAWAALKTGFTDAIGLAAKYETAQNRMIIALQSSGKFTESVVRSFNSFSQAMQDASGVSRDLISDVAGSNSILKITSDQAQVLTKNALGLSKALGVDLAQANKMLTATFTGEAGELKKLVPGIQSLTKLQLMAGAAVDIVGAQYNRFINSDATTFAGAIERMKNKLTDALKSIGGSLIEGFDFKENLPKVLAIFDDIKDTVDKNKDSFKELGSYLMTNGISALKDFAATFKELGPNIAQTTKDLVALLKVGIIPLLEVMVSAGSIWAFLRGDKEAERAYEQTMDRLKIGFNNAVDDLQWKGKLTQDLDDEVKSTEEKLTLWQKIVKSFKEHSFANDMKGMGQGINADVERNKNNADKWKDLLGVGQPAAKPAPGIGDLRASDIQNNYTKSPETSAAAKAAEDAKASNQKKFGQKQIERTQDMNEQELQMRRQLNAQLLALDMENGSKEALAFAQAQMQIVQMEQDAATKGLNITKETTAVKAAITRSFLLKVEDEYNASQLHIAQLAGDETNAAKVQYQIQMVELRRMLDQKLIDTKNFLKAARKAENDEHAAQIAAAEKERSGRASNKIADALNNRKRDQVQGPLSDEQTTTAADVDSTIGKASGFLSAAQSGVSAIVTQVGSMFGPFGALIAQIINFFGMAPDEFKKMIDSLLQGLKDLPKNIAANIPVLITQLVNDLPAALSQGIEHAFYLVPKLILDMLSNLIAALPKAFGKIFSAGFWSNIANQVYVALRDAFRNFFSVLFTGKGVKGYGDQIKKEASGKTDVATFGADTGGDDQFKIKDADLRGKRKATQSFEDSFHDTVEEGGKSFTDMLKEAFDSIMERLGAWFMSIPDKLMAGFAKIGNFGTDIWNMFKAAASAIGELGTNLWNGLANSAKVIGEWGKLIWDGLVKYANPIELGKKIWEGLSWGAEILKGWGKGLWDTFAGAASAIGELGTNIWRGFDNSAKVIGDYGRMIWDGLKYYASGISSWGASIWDGLKAGVNGAGSIFTNIGTTIYNGLKSGMSGIGSYLTNIFNGLNPANLFAKLFKVDMGGQGTVERTLGIDIPFMSFADGGKVPGQAVVGGDSYLNDRVLAMVSPGEAIIPRSKMADPRIAATVEQIMSGSLKLPQFKLGGILGKAQDVGILPNPGNPIPGITGPLPSVPGLPQIPSPDDLWKMVKQKTYDMIMNMFAQNHFASGGYVGNNASLASAMVRAGAMTFADGGMVPGAGFSDTVPAVLTPGEKVLTRDQVKNGTGGPVINLNMTFNISAGAKLDKDAIRDIVAPQVMEFLKRESKIGKLVVRQSGVY